MPIASSGSPGCPHFCLTWLPIDGSHNPLLRFNNLLQQLTEPRETFHLLLLVYYKGYYKAGVPNPWTVDQYWSVVCGLLGTGLHSRRWAVGKRAKLHLLLPIACITARTIPHPHLLKNCLPQNWSLVPKRLGTAVIRDTNKQLDEEVHRWSLKWSQV